MSEVHNAEKLVNITLDQLKEQPPYQRVSAKVTVLETDGFGYESS